MRSWSPLYDGDSIIHYGGAITLPRSAHRELPRTATSLWGAFAALAGRVIRWLERGAERARYRELERYLSESTDCFDLERRIRQVERSRAGVFDSYS